MEYQRLFLFTALGGLLLLLWTTWQQDYHQPKQLAQAPASQSAPQFAPSAPAPSAAGGTEAGSIAPPQATASGARDLPLIQVRTDLLEVGISPVGGDIRSVRLLEYSVSSQDKTPFSLMHSQPGQIYVAQSGLEARDGAAPGLQAVFQAGSDHYEMAQGQNELVVSLHWTADSGVRVEKQYIFHRDSYLIDLKQQVVNPTDEPWQGYQYVQLRRTKPTESKGFMFGARSYTGGVVHGPDFRYKKISFDDMASAKPLERDLQGGWLAMLEHYFVSAWVPPQDGTYRYYARANEGQYILGLTSPWQVAAAGGGTAVFSDSLYVGPKIQKKLAAAAPDLELTVDYGKLTIISAPLFWLLDKIHSVVGNWGWSIVLLTLLIKIVFYKLSETSYRSMARMRKMQPMMQSLKERYGDDRQRLNQEMMTLYKREKINPLGGCLPIVIQIPVFIALYWVLLESVELRQADWILWYHDLSAPDPYFILPLLMGVSMFLQQRLNPAPLDPIQARVMMALPLVFTVFFLFFPAGLVLYWVTNNILSIAQQWLITRRIERGQEK
jgi:YidC/Oxa1 family membrane protein insertase